jgi:DNA-binding NarL/FixJ family response regulator
MKSRRSNHNGKSILLVDDHGVVREGLRAMLQTSRTFSTVLEADSLQSARTLLRAHQPDLVLLDLSLRGESGFDLLVQMPSLCPQARTVVLSLHEERDVICKARDLGATAFVSKSALSRDILATLDAVLAGETRFPGHIAAIPPSAPTRALSRREFEIYLQIGRGHPVGLSGGAQGDPGLLGEGGALGLRQSA